ncbi:hypothetical protein IM697_31355 [Streptomyces ferrugineus]|uniref:Uncharacterized protein n=1 Tax=Streptomyces ferrugineus TaxID=1413221 RepID=A0A7M2SYK0_9ACTN|nr:hypothetical protein IM697_31355 [Streptomyces ferrugineus]
MFALAGSVLAALGHHAVAAETVPWRFVMLSAAAQFAVVRPLARRRLSLPAAVGCGLAMQGVLHLVLTIAGEPDPDGTDGIVHAGHGTDGMRGAALMVLPGGHAWQHVCAAMAAAHVLAAPAVAWLLHSADAAVAAAVATTRAVRRVAAAVAAWVRSLRGGLQARPLLPAVSLTGPAVAVARTRTRLLGHALVRRGPPGHVHVPSRRSPGRSPWAVRLSPQGAFLCPCTPLPARQAPSPSPLPPR